MITVGINTEQTSAPICRFDDIFHLDVCVHKNTREALRLPAVTERKSHEQTLSKTAMLPSKSERQFRLAGIKAGMQVLFTTTAENSTTAFRVALCASGRRRRTV